MFLIALAIIGASLVSFYLGCLYTQRDNELDHEIAQEIWHAASNRAHSDGFDQGWALAMSGNHRPRV